MGDRPLCVVDGRPVADTGYVCHACTDRLAEDLRSLAAVAGETAVSVARLDRHGDGGYTSAEQPLPFDWDASDAEWAAHNTVTTWARHASETRGRALPVPAPVAFGPLCRTSTWCKHETCATIRTRWLVARVEHPTARAAGWLADQLGWLRVRPESVEAFDELQDAVWLLRRSVDNPTPRWYAGQCWVDLDGAECDGELYVRPGASWIACPSCGIEHDVAERRRWLLERADDQLLHAGWMASALSALGEPVTSAMIRSYAHRGRIVAHGMDGMGRPLYRVGEVRRLIEARVVAA